MCLHGTSLVAGSMTADNAYHSPRGVSKHRSREKNNRTPRKSSGSGRRSGPEQDRASPRHSCHNNNNQANTITAPSAYMPQLTKPDKQLIQGSRSASPSDDDAYAGAKFSEPPKPADLPRPPVSWVSLKSPMLHKAPDCSQMTNDLKTMLKVFG
ncbi:proline-rich nuclear receptor coactivator 2-like [Branchiostoma floridae]|uniref:Proline-rich nuclear receptor coactivator 2-like n=2 Tax=Branchiostoma floridae TaxID=7739 RepID=A0A9J7KSF5_BRAFL|nr:proline-rich nuclear receptor coactivator 2-like [Branchiostoma floridae]